MLRAVNAQFKAMHSLAEVSCSELARSELSTAGRVGAISVDTV
jgi:hypothetical protein